MKNAFKVILKITSYTLALLMIIILITAATVGWVLKSPSQAWQLAEKYIVRSDIKVSWTKADFNFERTSGLNFIIDWQAENLLITKQDISLKLPIDHIHLNASILTNDPGQKFTIHNLHLIAVKDSIIIPASTKPKDPEENLFQILNNYMELLQSIHSWVKIEKVKLNIADLQLESKEGNPLRISLQANSKETQEAPEGLHYVVSFKDPKQNNFSVVTSGNINLLKLQTNEIFLQSKVDFEGYGAKTSQNISVQKINQVTVLKSEGLIEYKKNKLNLKIQPQLSIKIDENTAVTNLKSSIHGIPGYISKIKDLQLDLTTPLENNILWSEKPSDFKIFFPIEIFFIDKNMRQPFKEACQCRVPETLKAELKGQLWLAYLFSQPEDKKPILETHISIESFQNKLISIDLSGDFKIDKKLDKLSYLPSLDCKASIHHFQGFKKFLDAINILIPAPFNVLDGTIDLLAHGPVGSSEKDFSLPLSVTANLASPRQELKFKSQTEIKLTADFKEVFINLMASIESLQLELPPLDPFKGKPRITSDRRILKAPVIKSTKIPAIKVYISIDVETSIAGAIRLLSPYFQPHLPLTLSIQQSVTKTNSGFIQTEPFQIHYLRRKIIVEKMKLDIPQNDEDSMPIDASFKIKQTLYTITIDVNGPINKPNIVMSSEPYLSEDEIISVLLYDRTSNELASADAETAGGVQAAVADRAIGLFGLWAFAATPIKSFSYNPVTKIYTATVAITDDVTAGIGTNWEEATRLELRKRVSKRWMLTAAWTPATQEEKQSTKLVLQWEKRF